MEKNNTTEFINLYKELEQLKSLNQTLYTDLKGMNYELYEMFRNTRNVLAHNINNDGSYPILVSDELLNKLKKEIAKFKIRAKDIMIKSSLIKVANYKTSLKAVIKYMNDYNISHVPIVNESKIVTHVISANAIINILANNKGIINFDNSVANYLDFFKLENSDEYYLFVSENDFAYSLKYQFLNRVRNLRCGLIFVGKKGEKILGIIGSNELLKI